MATGAHGVSIENHVSLTGNLGNDPKISYTQSGVCIANVSLATTSRRKDRDGNMQERTEWHRVKFFGKLAEIVKEHMRKGDACQVIGALRYGEYADKEGIKRYTTDIEASEMKMLGKTSRDHSESSKPENTRRPPPIDDSEPPFVDDDLPF